MQTFAEYRVLEALDPDGSPEVYLAQREGESPVHLKVFRRKGYSGEAFLRLKRDLDALGQIEHVRIQPALARGNENGDLWYVTAPPEGQSVAQALEAREAAGESGLPMVEVLQLAIGLGEALGYLHEKGFVHGRLDARSIYLNPKLGAVLGETFPGDAEAQVATPEVAGLRYASLEQVQGERITPASDVYQAGLLLYHALTGRLPLEDENAFQTVVRRTQEEIPPPSRSREEVPEDLDQILVKCLRAKDRERYPDMNEFLMEVLRLDPLSGELLPGEQGVGFQKEEIDPFAGLLIPSGKEGRSVQSASAASAVIPGLAVGLLVLGLVLYALR